jgi:hypothetical protein
MHTEAACRFPSTIVATVALAVALAPIALGVPIAEAQQTPTVIRETNCIVVSANPKVPRENIDYLVAPAFRDKIATDPPVRGVPLPVPDLVPLAIQAIHCEAVTIGDSPPRETTWVVFRVPLGEEPDEERAQPQPHFDFYELWFASDNPEYVELWSSEGGAGPDAVYVPGLVFDLDLDPTGLGGRFELIAPEPTPSPFRMVGEVSRDIVGPLPEVTLHIYGAKPLGWMVVAGPDGAPDSLRGVRLGTAQGRVFTEPGSQLDRVFCDDTDGSFQNLLGGIVSFEHGGPATVTLDTSKPGFETPDARCP